MYLHVDTGHVGRYITLDNSKCKGGVGGLGLCVGAQIPLEDPKFHIPGFLDCSDQLLAQKGSLLQGCCGDTAGLAHVLLSESGEPEVGGGRVPFTAELLHSLSR